MRYGATGAQRLNDNAEFNSLVRDDLATVTTVPVETLDVCPERYGWKGIDFMKIDAEGEETNIIAGGRRFFAECSPLILYEVKAHRLASGTGAAVRPHRVRVLGTEVVQYLRLSTITRVARDYGARTIAMNAIKQLWDSPRIHDGCPGRLVCKGITNWFYHCQ